MSDRRIRLPNGLSNETEPVLSMERDTAESVTRSNRRTVNLTFSILVYAAILLALLRLGELTIEELPSFAPLVADGLIAVIVSAVGVILYFRVVRGVPLDGN